MVAYSFKFRFVDDIRQGIKPHTIRNDRKRHARPGEQVQLYTAMRTKACRLIGLATCVDVRPIRLDFDQLEVTIFEVAQQDIHYTTRAERDLFARFDGFQSWTDLVEFWRNERTRRDSGMRNGGPMGVFSGVIIRWKDFVDRWDEERKAA